MGLISMLRDQLDAHRRGMFIYDMAMQEMAEREARRREAAKQAAAQPMDAEAFSRAMQRQPRMPRTPKKK